MADIPALRALLDAATPTPWRWAGNTDTGDIRLDGTGKGGAVFDLGGVERTPDDVATKKYESYLRECGQVYDNSAKGNAGRRPMTDEEIADDVRTNWIEDPWGQVREDQRLRFYEPGFAYRPARDLAVFAVARNRGLPDDTPRSDERIYRADVVDVRNPNAQLIVAGINALPGLLEAAEQRDRFRAEADQLRAALERVAARLTLAEDAAEAGHLDVVIPALRAAAEQAGAALAHIPREGTHA